MHVFQRSLALALAVGVSAVLASGCGSDGDEDDAAGEVEAGVEAPGTTEAAADSPAATATTTGGAEEGDAGAGAAGGDVDACAYLAGVDLEALVGEPVATPEASTDMLGATCVVDPVADTSAGLRLIVTDQEPADNYANQREVLGVDSEVTGLGDEGFHTGPYLFVLRGEKLLFLQVVQDATTGAGVEDAALEAAMTTVLDNVPA